MHERGRPKAAAHQLQLVDDRLKSGRNRTADGIAERELICLQLCDAEVHRGLNQTVDIGAHPLHAVRQCFHKPQNLLGALFGERCLFAVRNRRRERQRRICRRILSAEHRFLRLHRLAESARADAVCEHHFRARLSGNRIVLCAALERDQTERVIFA